MENRIPRPEHPRPQMRRNNWMNLNGEWDFDIDFGKSGIERKFFERQDWKLKITVPFCPESELSGVNYKDFIPMVWYHRTVNLNNEQLRGRVLLHFDAVDYASIVWVNGVNAGQHKGGYSSFCIDVTDLLKVGINHITVCAEDDNRSGLQPKGKQSSIFYSRGCDYTRTTGIWQTVWLEFVPVKYIQKVQYYCNLAESSLTIKAFINGSGRLTAQAMYHGKNCGQAQVQTSTNYAYLTIPLDEVHLWEPGEGRLYDLKLQFEDDQVDSYFGMREIAINGEKFLINGQPVFQRLVLDQGFYPDGIYTAPNEEALKRDIQLSLDAGFNGARLHQKVFEPRFLYYCDKMGYLVWGEQGNWGLDYSNPMALKVFLPEWEEVVERDFNHPAIIGWCPFNETWDFQGRKQDDDLLRIVYRMTKLYDTTRPCIDTSGNFHVETDIYDVHDYEQNSDKFAAHYESFAQGGDLYDSFLSRQTPIKGVPVFVSEYGGIKWSLENSAKDGWGYGTAPESEEEFIERYQKLTDTLLDNPHMFGFCYTQLYDVEQEQNGLYTYHREPKFDMKIIQEINRRKAAFEKNK